MYVSTSDIAPKEAEMGSWRLKQNLDITMICGPPEFNPPQQNLVPWYLISSLGRI